MDLRYAKIKDLDFSFLEEWITPSPDLVKEGGSLGQNSKLNPKFAKTPNYSSSDQNSLLVQNSASTQTLDGPRVSPVRAQGGTRPRGRVGMLLVVPFRFSSGKCRELEFLVDTGAEVNLIRKDLVPSDCWSEAPKS